MGVQEVEILVHIAAPSAAANDADYRSFARAYLAFEPKAKTTIFGLRDSSSISTRETTEAVNHSQSQPGGNTSLFQESQQFISTQDFSFESAFGNMSSPELPRMPQQNTQEDQTQSSWVAPPSVIEDSMPDNNVAMTQFNSPTRMFEYFLSGLNSSQSDQSSVQERGLSQVIGGSQQEASLRRASQPVAPSSQRSNHGTGQNSSGVVGGPSQQSQEQSEQRDTTVYSEFEFPSQGWSQNRDKTSSASNRPPAPSQPRPVPVSTPPPWPQPSQEPGGGRQRRPRHQRTADQILGGQKAGSQKTGSQTVIPVSPLITNPKRPPPPSTTTSLIEETKITSSFPSFATNSFGSVIPSSHPQPPPSSHQPPSSHHLPPSSHQPSPSHPQPPPSHLQPPLSTQPPPSSHPRPRPPLSPSRAGSLPPTKRPRLSPPPLPRSTSDTGPRPPPKTAPTTSRLELLSPQPPTSLATLLPSDLITPSLAHLATQVDISRRFTPQSQTRELRPFERGYWLVDCSSWDEELRRSAWEFLGRHLEGGLVGWGVSCRRDEGFTWMRVYCWGGVVGHLYLVLWLASQRRVKATGTVWVAGDGERVVVMGARPPSR